MKHAVLLLALAAPLVAEQPKSEIDAAKERLAVAKILEQEFAKPAEQVKQEHREKAAAEVKAYWEEYERRAKAKSAALAASPTPAPESKEAGTGQRILEGLFSRPKREEPRQQVCYTETMIGPVGPTYRTWCH